jgi:hypothetical protein
MSDDRSDRLSLPLLYAAQAQKEVTHNEALAMLDIAVQASVMEAGRNNPPNDAVPGQCWIVGAVPVGAWLGHAGALAGWTGGGWRFVAPRDGMRAWDMQAGCWVVRVAGVWESGLARVARVMIGSDQILGARQPAISTPTGGSVIDVEARACLVDIVAVMQAHGLI